MATVQYSARALADFDRLVEFAALRDQASAVAAVSAIVDAVSVLERHPHIGRPVRGRLRELVISYGRTGYVALYRVSVRREQIEILAIRHQREAGYQS